ncbi:hypothetical protein K227x_27290 [Rubripirellula lacrimiformis]|uniref:Uncharacterized protein n=1 Tax=Rubripirellula lacrimiformis TaxID=1930273 RepID=A0A517NB23_9BACT|nr:hypothetical protein K227x_27290 [Rubripirellula lacrimiformis]
MRISRCREAFSSPCQRARCCVASVEREEKFEFEFQFEFKLRAGEWSENWCSNLNSNSNSNSYPAQTCG